MNKARLLVLAAFTYMILPVPNAQAQGFVVKLRVGNSSDTCAWVTVYTSRVLLPWSAYQARFIKKGGYYTWDIPFTQLLETPVPAEIKVRAEFMNDTRCNHPVIRDLEAENKGILPDQMFGRLIEIESELSGSPYSVSRPRK